MTNTGARDRPSSRGMATRTACWHLAREHDGRGYVRISSIVTAMASVGTDALRAQRRPTGPDTVVALGLAALALVIPWLTGLRLTWPDVALTAVSAAALREMRRWPRPALAITALATAVSVLGTWQVNLAGVAFSIAVFTYALRSSRPHILVVAFLSTVAFAAVASSPVVREAGGWHGREMLLWYWTVFTLALASQGLLTTHRAKLDRERHAEEVREEGARRRVAEERVRIAREIHDVIAHHVAVVGVQAAVGQQLIGRDDAGAREAMESVRTATKTVLTELQGLLGVLRQDEPGGPRSPVPGFRDIAELARSFSATGTHVDVHLPEEAPSLSPSADIAAYRLVQEALTNVYKHAKGARTVVRVVAYDDSIDIDVSNDSAAATGPDTPQQPVVVGFGLLGMRERITAVGGYLSSGPTPEGGFRVSATIPLDVEHA